MKIFLRPIEKSDTYLIINWRNNEKVLSHCLSRAPITEESHNKFYKEYIETGKYKQFIVECLEPNTGVAVYPIATVYLKDMDLINKRCELCVFTSNDSEWIAESQSYAISMLIDKAFKEFGMHKVYTYAFYKFNEEIELLKSAGFEVETILKDEALNEKGEYDDIVRLSMVNR